MWPVGMVLPGIRQYGGLGSLLPAPASRVEKHSPKGLVLTLGGSLPLNSSPRRAFLQRALIATTPEVSGWLVGDGHRFSHCSLSFGIQEQWYIPFHLLCR